MDLRLGFALQHNRDSSSYSHSAALMTSSSSSSSKTGHRRSVYGVPTRCWCGNNLKTFASQTKENPFRRFHICVIASQRETEDHLFKWEDEAILDEIRIVDAKRQDLMVDFQSLSNSVMEKLARQEASIGKLKEELAQTLQKINQVNDTQLEETDNINKTGVAGQRIHNAPYKSIGVAFVVLGVAAWFCFKLT